MNKKTTLKLNRDFRRLYYKGSQRCPSVDRYLCQQKSPGSQSYRHHRYQKNREGSLPKSLQENHTGGVCSGEHPNRAGMGFCVCCADENAAGKIYRARTGPQKTNPEPYKTGQVQTKRQSSKSKGTITQKKSAQRAEGFRTQGSCKRTIRERQRMYYKEGKQREASAA